MAKKMSNQEVGDRIGLTHSAVSRLRSGQRLPSLKVMSAISQAYGWDLVEQINVRTAKGAAGYAVEFNNRLQAAVS